jgi:hypothetical protein
MLGTMSTKLSVTSAKPSNVKSISAAPAPAASAPAADVAGAEAVSSTDEGAKRQRQAYEPKTVADYETEITKATEVLRGFKTRLYPTSNPKASAESAPTRREFDDVITKLRSLTRDYRALHRRAEAKPRRKTAATATGKPRPGGFKNPCLISEKLAQFLGDNFNTPEMTIIDDSKICTRALLTSMLTQYAYDNNRRDPTAPTKVIPDAAMSELFKDDFVPAKVDPKGFPHTHMQKLLTRHVAKADEFKAFLEAQGPEFKLDEYKIHLENVQENFKARKAAREAARPKPKKAKAKKAEAAVEPAATLVAAAAQ